MVFLSNLPEKKKKNMSVTLNIMTVFLYLQSVCDTEAEDTVVYFAVKLTFNIIFERRDKCSRLEICHQ